MCDNVGGWNLKAFLAHLKYQQPQFGDKKQSCLDIVIDVNLYDAISGSNNIIWFFFYICLAGTKCLGGGKETTTHRIQTYIYLYAEWHHYGVEDILLHISFLIYSIES